MKPVDDHPRLDPAKLAARECLLLCVGSHADAAGLESLLRRGIDWAYLLDDLGPRHHLLPLAYERLRRMGGDLVPPDVMARLQGIYYANLRRIVRLQADMAEVVTALHEVGIEPIVLKGGALAGTVYPDPGLRPMADLDLLVPTKAMEQAGTALSGIGYHLSGGLPARMVAFQQRFGGGLEYLRKREGRLVRLDLQHDLVGVDFCRHAFAIEAGDLWPVARPLSLNQWQGLPRGQVLQLSAEDMLIHLCLHPALHHGYASPLIGTVDIDRLVAVEGSEEFWGRVIERAGQFRVRPAVYHGLCCARALLDTPVPAGTLAALVPGALRRRLLAWLAPLDKGHVWERTTRSPSGLHQLLLYAALMERPRDALGMIRAILFPNREWLAVRYGLQDERQARLYSLVHPFRVARAFVRGLHRPLIQSSLD